MRFMEMLFYVCSGLLRSPPGVLYNISLQFLKKLWLDWMGLLGCCLNNLRTGITGDQDDDLITCL
ncbi:hypothetical protein SAMN02927921_02177 [Sinomicrobium oceani]|uniref:Uncharacterized protein n=1 Tax=Sinomicrobium oceani TaxID=1150368 RepID=A0A1K1Q1S6_9FLAO|nr:hypothetical protein SAMN02927921_02177 [Sinomicrobium oceani]